MVEDSSDTELRSCSAWLEYVCLAGLQPIQAFLQTAKDAVAKCRIDCLWSGGRGQPQAEVKHHTKWEVSYWAEMPPALQSQARLSPFRISRLLTSSTHGLPFTSSRIENTLPLEPSFLTPLMNLAMLVKFCGRMISVQQQLRPVCSYIRLSFLSSFQSSMHSRRVTTSPMYSQISVYLGMFLSATTSKPLSGNQVSLNGPIGCCLQTLKFAISASLICSIPKSMLPSLILSRCSSMSISSSTQFIFFFTMALISSFRQNRYSSSLLTSLLNLNLASFWLGSEVSVSSRSLIFSDLFSTHFLILC